MFVLCTLQDKVRIEPKNLQEPIADAVTAVLEATFLDKVVLELGLVVTIYDILSISEGQVFTSDGGAHVEATFRVVAFRPSPGELIIGKVISQHQEHGVKVSLGFFEDLYIPPYGMPDPHSWDAQEQAWSWDMEDDDGSVSRLFFETGLRVRLQVTGLTFRALPTPLEQAAAAAAGEPVPGSAAAPHAPLTIATKADGDGLGMVHWYEESGDMQQ